MARTGGGLLSLSIAKLFVYDWVGGGTRGFSRAAAFVAVGWATLPVGSAGNERWGNPGWGTRPDQLPDCRIALTA